MIYLNKSFKCFCGRGEGGTPISGQVRPRHSTAELFRIRRRCLGFVGQLLFLWKDDLVHLLIGNRVGWVAHGRRDKNRNRGAQNPGNPDFFADHVTQTDRQTHTQRTDTPSTTHSHAGKVIPWDGYAPPLQLYLVGHLPRGTPICAFRAAERVAGGRQTPTARFLALQSAAPLCAGVPPPRERLQFPD